MDSNTYHGFEQLLEEELFNDRVYLTTDEYANFVTSLRYQDILSTKGTLHDVHDAIQTLANKLRDKYYLLLEVLELTGFSDLIEYAKISNRLIIRTYHEIPYSIMQLVISHYNENEHQRLLVVSKVLEYLKCTLDSQHPSYEVIDRKYYQVRGDLRMKMVSQHQ